METPEQELEALKNWWQENGRTIVLGVAIGLGGVVGWNWWQENLRGQAEEASLIYQQVVDDAAVDNHQSIRSKAGALIDAYPKSGYAALAALLAAKSAFAENDFEGAKRQLNWVIENAEKTSFKDVARLRLARILAQEDAFDEGLAVLDGVNEQAFSASASEIRGDILLAKGDPAGAREAYSSALASDAATSQTRSRVQMKIDDLGDGDAANVSG